ncbi:MAG: ABC transporter ATP-binding protein [Rhizobiaceae bacterium]|nr:ABC transporter ATP-binding protein [Rhizobiaceae bacterium]
MSESTLLKPASTSGAPTGTKGWHPRKSAGVSFALGMRLENISYSVDGEKILDDITLEVEPGQVVCLLGPSGSGKTSLLRIAAGLIEGASGKVLIDNRVVADGSSSVPPEKRGVGLVFQDYALFPHLTIGQNVEFGLTAMSRSEARDQAKRVLSRVGLDNRADDYPHVLSGGEQQRVALARALAPRPGILLMDEPFSGLDSRLRDQIRQHSLDLLRETRSTAIIVTHDAEEALRVGDQIALIQDGKLVQQGSGREMYYNPKNLFVAAFFSEINIIPADIGKGVVTTLFGQQAFDEDNGAEAFAAIRQSDINIAGYVKGDPGLPGRIVSRRFLGTSELLNVAVEGLNEPLQVRVKPGILQRDETDVLLSVDPDLMMIFPQTDK